MARRPRSPGVQPSVRGPLLPRGTAPAAERLPGAGRSAWVRVRTASDDDNSVLKATSALAADITRVQPAPQRPLLSRPARHPGADGGVPGTGVPLPAAPNRFVDDDGSGSLKAHQRWPPLDNLAATCPERLVCPDSRSPGEMAAFSPGRELCFRFVMGTSNLTLGRRGGRGRDMRRWSGMVVAPLLVVSLWRRRPRGPGRVDITEVGPRRPPSTVPMARLRRA